MEKQIPIMKTEKKWPTAAAYSRPSSRRNFISDCIATLFFNSRSPKAIKENRQRLLRRRSSTSSASSDLESQDSDYSEKKVQCTSSRLRARIMSDAIIGLSDGLTVPFALTAGLSTLGNTKVVIFAGLAELTAGSISMGLGGYLAAKFEEDSYNATLASTRRIVVRSPSEAMASVKEIFEPYELPERLTDELAENMARDPKLVQFLMLFQHSQPAEMASRAVMCAVTIACGYFLGGFLPLIPYFLVQRDEVQLALWWSFMVMAFSLFAFGYGKTCFVSGWAGQDNLWLGVKGGVQMLLVGSIAALSAMGFVRFFDSWDSGPLAFVFFNPLSGTNHTGTAKVAIREAKKKLYNDKVEEVALHDCSSSFDVAEVISTNPYQSPNSKTKYKLRSLGQR
ncbi:hypothetical protein AC579_592 [Pseudocercospora musae]|uniref:Uncharacterized protein n=1 Tax=Pseudocercospora musae TaxID=113226 RepID=A0A139ICM0_9PEZI|nr:hypothetical protein AC579_592 [Pseudocercospora musae]